MATAQDIIDHARVPLNDADKTRYTDAALLAYLNFGLMYLRGHRPDMFLGALSGDMTALSLTGTVTIEQQYHQALADYIAGRAETLDDEAAVSGRAAAFFALAGGVL